MEDVDRSLAFWHGTLGIPLKLRCEGIAELQTEGVAVTLVAGRPVAGSTSIGWEVEDLEAARRELEARGVSVTEVPPRAGVDPAAHGRRLAFADPDGHRLELVGW